MKIFKILGLSGAAVMLALSARQIFAATLPRVNEELASSYRSDLIGPEMWTGQCQTGMWDLNGTAQSYQEHDVPFLMVPRPRLGLSGRLSVVHEVVGLEDALTFKVLDGGKELKFGVVRNHWTPAMMTTYYRSEKTAAEEGPYVGSTVVKEVKAILEDNTFLAEVTIKNASADEKSYTIEFETRGGLPKVGEGAKEWVFETVSMLENIKRKTYACAKGSLDGSAANFVVKGHGEVTFRYALALAAESAAEADRRVRAALLDGEAFRKNVRSFDEWYGKNVPRFETASPDLRKMYLYRWFVVKRSIHEARRVIAGHEYPRRAIYESPYGAWFDCVIGLPVPVQIVEARWMRDASVVRDHVLNWCEGVRGYRGYIQFTGHSIAELMKVHPSREFAEKVYPAVKEFAGGEMEALPVQVGSWMTGAEYQPNFYQFTEPKWDYRRDKEYTNEVGYARLVRLDTAMYGIGNMLGAAKIAEMVGKKEDAAEFEARAKAAIGIIRSRHWDEKLGMFLAAEPGTYRLADEAPCYDSFAPYLWGTILDEKYLKAFDKLMDRDWFWDDFPLTTCAKWCVMYNSANCVVSPNVGTRERPHTYGCSWNGPTWHYANGLYAAAFGEAAREKKEWRGKWLEFFDGWNETQWAYGDRTAPRAAEHFRPEDGGRNSGAWDYFHSAWLNPFYLYWCGISISDDLKTIRFEPFTEEEFCLENVPLGGKEYTFEQRRKADGTLERVVEEAGRGR